MKSVPTEREVLVLVWPPRPRSCTLSRTENKKRDKSPLGILYGIAVTEAVPSSTYFFFLIPIKKSTFFFLFFADFPTSSLSSPFFPSLSPVSLPPLPFPLPFLCPLPFLFLFCPFCPSILLPSPSSSFPPSPILFPLWPLFPALLYFPLILPSLSLVSSLSLMLPE